MNRELLYKQVAQQIEAAIVAGQWPAGSRIPTERQLRERFGVSRTVIREALKALVERGSISIQPRRGTFVSELTTSGLREPIALLLQRHNIPNWDLAEARRVIETEIAGLVAERAEHRQIETLRSAFAAMEEHMEDPEEFIRADRQFHAALAESTHNLVFLFLIDAMAELMGRMQQVAFQVEGSPQRAQRYHQILLEAIVLRDTGTARSVMRDHLGQFETDVRAASSAVIGGRS